MQKYLGIVGSLWHFWKFLLHRVELNSHCIFYSRLVESVGNDDGVTGNLVVQPFVWSRMQKRVKCSGDSKSICSQLTCVKC